MSRRAGRGAVAPGAVLALTLLAAVPAGAQRVERYPEQFGPFALGAEPGHRLTVTGVYQRLLDAKEYWRSTTLEYWSIQSDSRAILARGREPTKTQPPGEFVEAWGLSAYLLEGGGRPMLLLVFGVVPSPPTSGLLYRVFGFDRHGVFREALTLRPYGDGVMNPIESARGTVRLAEGRYLDVSEWLGSFALRIRYEYDEAAQRFLPRNTCGSPLKAAFDREAMRAALERGGDPRVALYDSPRAGASHRLVKLDEKSQVRLLQACTARFTPSRLPDVWLKVDIDSATGWASEDDFAKLGLAGDG